MPGFDIANPQHINHVIERVRTVAIRLAELRAELAELDTEMSAGVNNVGTALSAPGAAFPPGYSLTPPILNSARNALTGVVMPAINTALTASQQLNLDRVRLDIGVITGTG